MSALHEECGVFGIWSPHAAPVAHTVYYGLYALQHRGQESCGIVVCRDGQFTSHKDLGLVHEVFPPETMAAFPDATMAVGHVRYSTTGGLTRANCQPIEVFHRGQPMALAHNGNLSNGAALRRALENDGAIFHSTSDTEVIAYLFTRARMTSASLAEAVQQTMAQLDGAYSLLFLCADCLIAVRDPHGFRPLCIGRTADGARIVASESCALQAVGAVPERDIAPGEIVLLDDSGVHSIQTPVAPRTPCIFEYIYFARPDSVIDGVSVHGARLRAGALLAQAHPVDADVVIGVPDSGLDAALGYANASGIPYGIGFTKNKYIGRTFIEPTPGERVNLVQIKLNPIRETVAGKRVVLVDDSLVRGTTSRQIVRLLRDAGATEIHLRVSAPPFRNPCYYGTDIDSREHLIACRYTVPEIAARIGADSLGYLPAEALAQLIGSPDYCAACFTGAYPTAVEDSGVLDNR